MKLYHWCIAHKLSINSDKTNLVLFHLKNKPVLRDFTGLQTQSMEIDRVQSVQYLGMLLDETLYCHGHVTRFLDYYKDRETEHELRNNRTLDIPWARTVLGQSRCDIKGARLWNMYFDTVNPLLHRKSFRKHITKYFVSKYIWLIRHHCVSSFIISTAIENICIAQMCICAIYKIYTSYCHFPTRCIVHSANSSLGWRGAMTCPSSL